MDAERELVQPNRNGRMTKAADVVLVGKTMLHLAVHDGVAGLLATTLRVDVSRPCMTRSEAHAQQIINTRPAHLACEGAKMLRESCEGGNTTVHIFTRRRWSLPPCGAVHSHSVDWLTAELPVEIGRAHV